MTTFTSKPAINDPLSFEDRDSVAYRAGRAARYVGQPFETNPYVEGSARRPLWSRGWIEQDADPDQITPFNRAGYRPDSYALKAVTSKFLKIGIALLGLGLGYLVGSGMAFKADCPTCAREGFYVGAAS